MAEHVLSAPAIEPADVGCGGRLKRAVLGRFLMFEHVYELDLWPAEVEAVDRSFPDTPLADRPLATRYLCWRRSVLGCALVPSALSLLLRLRTVAGSLNKEEFLQSVSPETDLIVVEEYWVFFENYFYVHAAVQVLYAASLVLSLALMAVAWRTWASFGTSRRWLRTAYLLSFAVPFMLLMVAPYKQAIDGAGAEKQLCEDMLEQGNASLSRARFACSLPDANMCTKPSDRWTPEITRTLTECGVMRDPQTDTCPFAAEFAARALSQNSLASSTLSPAVQQLCMAPIACGPCIEAGSQSCSNMALAVAGPQPTRDRCARCFIPVSEWRAPSPPTVALTDQQWSDINAAGIGNAGDLQVCAQVCAPLLVDGLSTSYAEQLSTGRGNEYCVGENTISVINSVTALALHFDKVSDAVGVYYIAI